MHTANGSCHLVLFDLCARLTLIVLQALHHPTYHAPYARVVAGPEPQTLLEGTRAHVLLALHAYTEVIVVLPSP